MIDYDDVEFFENSIERPLSLSSLPHDEFEEPEYEITEADLDASEGNRKYCSLEAMDWKEE